MELKYTTYLVFTYVSMTISAQKSLKCLHYFECFYISKASKDLFYVSYIQYLLVFQKRKSKTKSGKEMSLQ